MSIGNIFGALYQQQAAINQYNQLGGLYGRHWATNQALSGYPYQPSNTGNQGADAHVYAFLAAQQAACFAQPEPIEDAGIRAGEVRAWRCWRIKGGFLLSMAVDRAWGPGEPMTKGTDIGVHAWKSLSHAIDYGQQYWESWKHVVIGQVDLWGEITEHELGYTAEYGGIASLDYMLGGVFKSLKLARLRARYLSPSGA